MKHERHHLYQPYQSLLSLASVLQVFAVVICGSKCFGRFTAGLCLAQKAHRLIIGAASDVWLTVCPLLQALIGFIKPIRNTLEVVA